MKQNIGKQYIINDDNIMINEKNDFQLKCFKIMIAIVAICCICVQIAELVTYHIYYIWDEGDVPLKNAYWDCKSINLFIEFIIFTRSIYLQRDSFNNIHIDNGTMQSNAANILLIFMAGLYFASLGSLSFYKRRLLTECIFDFAYSIGLLFVATHFIGSLRWGKISSSSKNYHWCSANWWCCIYLIVAFFSFMIITVVSPWFGYNDFLEISQDFEDITGEFVHVLIMYGCRPALTIVAFRCIEQILHQLGHKHHDHTAQQLLIIHDEFDDDDSDDINKNVIEFHRIKAFEFICAAPFIVFVVVFDLMTLSDANSDIASRYNFLIWFFVFGIQCIWSMIVILRIRKKLLIDNNYIFDINHVISKHLTLFISATGLIIALIGIIGNLDNIWEVWLTYIIDIVYIILQCYSLVLINESKLNIKMFKDCMPWMISKYGKVVVMLHVTLIIHGFLDEGYHLEETMNTEIGRDEGDVFGAIEFIFFFWSIEFHLACIERIAFTDQ